MGSRHHSASQDELRFNGIDGLTGRDALAPMEAADLAEELRERVTLEQVEELRREAEQRSWGSELHAGVDPDRLEEAGWGLVLPASAERRLFEEALAPLLALRRRQAGDRFRIFAGDEGCRPGESAVQFLARHGARQHEADPERLPYYLLLAGAPAEIPFVFQAGLDVHHAVGRIAFDTLDGYARYAESAAAAEKGQGGRSPLVFFAAPHVPEDAAAARAERELVRPLAESILRRPGNDWSIRLWFGARATQEALVEVLAGGERPALVFAYARGVEFPATFARRAEYQGALLGADGIASADGGALPRGGYLAAGDLRDDAADVKGLLAVLLASSSVGVDDGQASFLAALPKRLLGHPRGGALAVIGQVGAYRGFPFAFTGAAAGEKSWEQVLGRLLAGQRLGAALEPLAARRAELAGLLAGQLADVAAGSLPDPHQLAGLCCAYEDARGQILLGDPAVRLAVPRLGPTRQAPPSLPPAVEHSLGVRGTADPEDLDETFRSLPPTRSGGDRSIGGEKDSGDRSLSPGEYTERGVRGGLERPAAAPAEVLFSAFPPRALEPGVPQPLRVYLHLAAALAEIEADAKAHLGPQADDFRRREAREKTRLAEGTEVLLVPSGPGLAFAPPSLRLAWSPPWQKAEFQVQSDASRAGQVAQGSIACYAGPLLIAQIPLPIVIRSADDTYVPLPQPGAVSAKLYPAIFASYSHDDTVLVEALEKAYKALGMDYLRDVMTLKPGQSWSHQLLRLIEDADIFQLFWSHAASQSAYVEQEWRKALEIRHRKSEAFIRPICWQDPKPRIPRELSSLHFAQVELGPFGALIPPAGGEAEAASAAELTVRTFASYDPGEGSGGRLVARTRVVFGGEVENWVAPDAEPALLAHHHESVREAVKTRLAYLELQRRRS